MIGWLSALCFAMCADGVYPSYLWSFVFISHFKPQITTVAMLDTDRKSNLVKVSLPSNIWSSGSLKAILVQVQRGHRCYLWFNFVNSEWRSCTLISVETEIVWNISLWRDITCITDSSALTAHAIAIGSVYNKPTPCAVGSSWDLQCAVCSGYMLAYKCCVGTLYAECVHVICSPINTVWASYIIHQ